jgi:hypothetical protein
VAGACNFQSLEDGVFICKVPACGARLRSEKAAYAHRVRHHPQLARAHIYLTAALVAQERKECQDQADLRRHKYGGTAGKK